MPVKLPNETNTVNIHNQNITKLCERYAYESTVTKLNLSSNKLQEICPSFLTIPGPISELEILDISNNLLVTLPKEIKNLKRAKEISLSKNPFKCTCNTIWMTTWLTNFTTPRGKQVVRDHTEASCNNGPYAGKKVTSLDKVEMGCVEVPHHMPLWSIIILAIGGLLIIVITAVMFVVMRRWTQVKFWLFKNFNILDKRDKDENLEGIQFDALISYRYVISFIVLHTSSVYNMIKALLVTI